MVSANLTWLASAGATGYKVEYKLAADASWTQFANNHGSTSCTISGLQAATVYDFRVTSNCAVGNASPVTLTATTICESTNVSEPVYLVQVATPNNVGGDSTIAVNRRHEAYGQSGTRIFEVGEFNSEGQPDGGTPTIINSASFYMNNMTLNTVDGKLNNTGVWGANQCIAPTYVPLANEFIGFTRTVVVPTSKTYYMGVGADNYLKLTIDGSTLIESVFLDVDSFRFWSIYPVFLTAGTHVLGIYGKDDGTTSASFGGEIYNNTKEEIIAAESDDDLDIIYSTSQDFCQPFDSGTTVGYTCPAGWVLDTSENPPKCIKPNVAC